MTEDHIDPIELLKEEMATDETIYKVNAIHRLTTVVMAIGMLQTYNKLIPFLDNLIRKEEDEVLFAIAEELGKISGLIENKLALLPLLEALCCMDETVVREQAVKSLFKIADTLSNSDIQNIFAPMVIRLSTTESLASRISSINLVTACYRKAGTQKEKIRKRFIELCKEETPLIRKTCATIVGSFSGEVEKELLIADIFPCFKHLTADEQDIIRVICIESLIQIVKNLTKEDNQRLTLPILLTLCEDKSWKVRLSIAKNFAAITGALGKDISDANLVPKLALILKDVEADVRAVAIESVKQCFKSIGADKIQGILLPALACLVQDTSHKVKAGLGGALCEISTMMKKDVSASKIVPILVDLLKDEHHEVKMGVLSGLLQVAVIVGPDFISSTLLMSLSNLMKEAQWRVRHEVVKLIANLGKEFGKDFFMKNLEPIFAQFYTDNAFEVRETGIEKVQLLSSEFKADWVVNSYIPKAAEVMLKEKLGYLYRMTVLNSLMSVTGVLTKEQIGLHLVPLLLKSVKDPIPNVKFCLAKILKKVILKVDPAVVASKIKPALSELSGDPDRDVQFFAKQALASC